MALGWASLATAAPAPAAEPATPAQASGGSATPLPEGDPGRGRALFLGRRRLAAGGPPCGACHAAGGEREPMGATLGPELSRSFEGMDRAALDGLLQDLPFPTMVPVYAGRALTPGERADLAAYLLRSSGQRAPRGRAIPLEAGLVAAALLGALALAGGRRKRPPREELRQGKDRGGTR